MGGGQLLMSGNLDWKAYVQMAFMAALGIAAKDFNVTGGMIQQ